MQIEQNNTEDKKYDFLVMRINRFFPMLTTTQQHIAQELIKNPAVISQQTIEGLAEITSSSTSSVYSFIKNIGFESIYDLKTFVSSGLEAAGSNENISVSIDKTIKKISLINFDAIVSDLKKSQQIVIVSRGATKFISYSLNRKLIKLGFKTLMINGNDDLDFMNKQKSADNFWIFISISGKIANDLNDYKNFISLETSSLFITCAKPSSNLYENFKYILYGYPRFGYGDMEFDFPNDSELLTLAIVNELVKRIAKEI